MKINKLKIMSIAVVVCCLVSVFWSETLCADNKDGFAQQKIFCCDRIVPYKNRYTDHEDLFKSFVSFSSGTTPSLNEDARSVQLVRQKNFGPILEERYFVLPDFQEVTKNYYIENNYKRLNSFKNYKCATHDLFFEVNAYSNISSIRSNHHLSTISGSTYSRDGKSIDFGTVQNKGVWDREKK
jgi:hypothetical protein